MRDLGFLYPGQEEDYATRCKALIPIPYCRCLKDSQIPEAAPLLRLLSSGDVGSVRMHRTTRTKLEETKRRSKPNHNL